ncbi:MAG TPA: 7-cyano-7-deazaguanine synthase QueC [Kiritimatiellia bacterium]|nr:7-cyano-7-deazaguanine synthase QueC [Kiritimatiellia bacterium]HNS80708.1 7-cyano-7-deazaguanine synthase QueC [Kiritimatiellia bacterium]HPA77271.1 7-cyano-7-deazaguanine synthase QueC [Kiritimatiellia bacterium]HQQ03241.1 7-cyano-7-deazaguanine synthase QueC [Kiritimatiellia bacterium]
MKTDSAKPVAVVAMSGGLDSCVTAAIAAQDYEPALLHVNYGQRTEARELKAFNDIADFYGVKRRLVISLDALKAIGHSSLTDFQMPVSEANLESTEVPASYVPFRNAHMLATAASWGEVLGAKAIFIGAVEEDSSGYPDCRAAFYRAFEAAIEEGTKPETHMRIITPVITLNKAAIVKEGLRLGAPLHLSWSCYQSEDKACGVCDSCALRLRGFRQAGVEDPIPYAIRPNY